MNAHAKWLRTWAAEIRKEGTADYAASSLEQSAMEIDRLCLALEFFRHMRVIPDDGTPSSFDIRDLRDGKDVTIGYARSDREVNEFNEAFERVRQALGSTSYQFASPDSAAPEANP